MILVQTARHSLTNTFRITKIKMHKLYWNWDNGKFSCWAPSPAAVPHVCRTQGYILGTLKAPPYVPWNHHCSLEWLNCSHKLASHTPTQQCPTRLNKVTAVWHFELQKNQGKFWKSSPLRIQEHLLLACKAGGRNCAAVLTPHEAAVLNLWSKTNWRQSSEGCLWQQRCERHLPCSRSVQSEH